jgi:hypothetical protein
MADDESEEEWRFSVEDFEDSPTEEAAVASASDRDATPATAEGEGNVAGEFAPQVPVDPERPKLENAAVITLGVALTVVAIASVIGGPAFGLLDAATILVVVGALGAVTYGALLRLTPDT